MTLDVISPRIVRRETPPPLSGVNGYRKAKEHLRRDFDRRCAYCLIPESSGGGPEHFWIDHFRPLASGGPRNDYRNLYWACIGCNHIKADRWPSAAELSNGYRFADPCKEQDYGFHFEDDGSGILIPKTPCGEYHIARLLLNRQSRVQDRIRRKQLREKIEEAYQLIAELADTAPPGYVDLIRSLISQLEAIT